MKWTAPIELCIDAALFLWLWEVVSHPEGFAKRSRKSPVSPSGLPPTRLDVGPTHSCSPS